MGVTLLRAFQPRATARPARKGRTQHRPVVWAKRMDTTPFLGSRRCRHVSRLCAIGTGNPKWRCVRARTRHRPANNCACSLYGASINERPQVFVARFLHAASKMNFNGARIIACSKRRCNSPAAPMAQWLQGTFPPDHQHPLLLPPYRKRLAVHGRLPLPSSFGSA